jgi:hypothetical protein
MIDRSATEVEMGILAVRNDRWSSNRGDKLVEVLQSFVLKMGSHNSGSRATTQPQETYCDEALQKLVSKAENCFHSFVLQGKKAMTKG